MNEIDWSTLLVPSGSVIEIVIRGTAVYLTLFLAMRFLPRRTIGGVGPSDLLIIVLIADAVQNAMGGDYKSITEGLVLAATIIGWAVLIDRLDYHFPRLHIADARAVALVRNGHMIARNMRRQNITEDEVMSQLRLHGLTSLTNVEAMYVEGDGQFSVLLRGGKPLEPPRRHAS